VGCFFGTTLLQFLLGVILIIFGAIAHWDRDRFNIILSVNFHLSCCIYCQLQLIFYWSMVKRASFETQQQM
jgi:hypothetical protein